MFHKKVQLVFKRGQIKYFSHGQQLVLCSLQSKSEMIQGNSIKQRLQLYLVQAVVRRLRMPVCAINWQTVICLEDTERIGSVSIKPNELLKAQLKYQHFPVESHIQILIQSVVLNYALIFCS